MSLTTKKVCIQQLIPSKQWELVQSSFGILLPKGAGRRKDEKQVHCVQHGLAHRVTTYTNNHDLHVLCVFGHTLFGVGPMTQEKFHEKVS